jgi:hypothetical protein
LGSGRVNVGGAWHIHAVCNQRFDLEWLRSKAMRAGFGPVFHVQELDYNRNTPEKIARYITGYCTDKNGLDSEKDKGVRRTIFVGEHVKVVNMRYKSGLKRVTALGKELAGAIGETEYDSMSKFERHFSSTSGRKKSWETWGDWHRRNRDYWFRVGWHALTGEERGEILELDNFTRRYLESGRWTYI